MPPTAHPELDQLREEVRALRTSVEGLVDAWRTVKGVVVFVKWAAGVIAAFGIIWGSFRGHVGVSFK